MTMKECYLTKDFRASVARRFPERAAELNAAFDARMTELWHDNADASEDQKRHLRGQILPGIAAYETLQRVMPKREALQLVHDFVEKRAWKLKKTIRFLLHIPGLYRCVPELFRKKTPQFFGETAGFAANEIQTSGGVWRIDMTRCPYHDACVKYGCSELCPCFCDSDDITYGDLHKNLVWHRTKTLGRGDDCCDFLMKVKR